ncbi:hypothetical protein [Streptomyces sp. MBT62]|uniref:hypothetical protein n=1 Tax=Streptomyces sp. MBT62 TaxID=2800410 RepID=UPI00190D3C33|nr:hypothetical protein [Streptomyces sp. MBT62]MBK3568600.1 hypothetical protein [Streptomyces sp. MBT62]
MWHCAADLWDFVTLGLHKGERTLVDLSRLSGPIALTGDDDDVLRLAQALTSEVVSGPVGTLATVVLVGSASVRVPGKGPPEHSLDAAEADVLRPLGDRAGAECSLRRTRAQAHPRCCARPGSPSPAADKPP